VQDYFHEKQATGNHLTSAIFIPCRQYTQLNTDLSPVKADGVHSYRYTIGRISLVFAKDRIHNKWLFEDSVYIYGLQ
jgi:hypothetical protein